MPGARQTKEDNERERQQIAPNQDARDTTEARLQTIYKVSLMCVLCAVTTMACSAESCHMYPAGSEIFVVFFVPFREKSRQSLD